jgi:hypothetical protein
MHETERSRLLNEFRRFRFAEGDMLQAAAAAEALLGENKNGELCRALETALAICYARPFTGSGVGRLDEGDWAPDGSARKFHDDLMTLRHKVYAHVDRTEWREVIDLGELLGEEFRGHWTEQWAPVNREALPGFVNLCRWQAARFRRAADDRRRQLVEAASLK